jgi:putative acetyltransferase
MIRWLYNGLNVNIFKFAGSDDRKVTDNPMQHSTNTATIRTIRPADNPTMARIIRQVMTEYGAVGEGYSINDPEVDHMYEQYASPDSAFFVVEAEGKVVGGAGIAPLQGGGDGVCELRKMYLLPEGRGRGWGRQLLGQCLSAARERGFRMCYLETVHRMGEAQRLYLSSGFKLLTGPMGNTGHNSCNAWYARELVD